MTSPADDLTATPPAAWPAGQPAEDDTQDDDLFAPGWDAPQRTNRLTVVLVALILAALGFAGGVVVQKAHDRGLVSASGARARGAGGGTGAGAAAGGGAAGSGATAGGDAPVAVGTVKSVSGTTLTLTNFGGTLVTVAVPATATVTTDGLGAPAPGDTVSVTGTKAADGAVTATSVTTHHPAR